MSIARAPRTCVLALLALAASGVACGGASPRTSYSLDYSVPTALSIPSSRTRLGNGLEVVVHEDHRSPFVAVNLWYRVGSADDPAGRAGMAHFVEHLMFDGSPHVAVGEHVNLLKRAGGFDFNATTNADRTNYFETVPKNALPLALWLESERMAFLRGALADPQIARERSVVKNELHQRYDNVPGGWFRKYVQAALYPPAHPYHHLPIGEVEELDRVTRDDLEAFLGRYYVPNNATLVLAGDVDTAAARALVQKYFADVPAGDPVPARARPELARLGERRIVIEADVERPEVRVAWALPPALSPGTAEMSVGAAGVTWWKPDGAVTEQRAASFEQGDLASTLTVTLALGKGKSHAAALELLDDHLHAMRSFQHHFDRTQFAIARAQFSTRLMYGIESLGARADTLNRGLYYADDPELVGRELAAYQAVSVEAVRDAYYQFLPFDDRVVAFVVPTPGAPRSGRLRGQR